MIAAILLAAAATAGCSLPAGWSTLDAGQVRYLVFARVHGTREGPGAVGEVACALARRGEGLLVALELDDAHA